MLRITLLAIFFVSVFNVYGQKTFSSEYGIGQIKDIPAESQDSFYLVQGKYYYAFYTRESYRKSMECYLEALQLAIQYNHAHNILECYFSIGSVYDANNNIDQAIKYYKLYYDGVLKERPFNPQNALRAMYNIAGTYAKEKDTVQTFYYTLKMAEMLNWVKDSAAIHNQYCLLIAHNFGLVGKQKEFFEYFSKITLQTNFSDGELAYGRYYAECKSNYAILKGEPTDSVTTPILRELSRTKDSVSILNFLITTYASIGEYKQAYECQQTMINADKRSMDRNTYGDINYHLLEADNLLKQHKNSELELTTQRLRLKSSLLYVIACLLVLGFVVTLYRYRRYRIKNKLRRFSEKHLVEDQILIKRVHSGLQQNLEVLNKSWDTQLEIANEYNNYFKGEIKASLNAITLAYKILEVNADIHNVALQPYFETFVAQTLETLNYEDIPITIEMAQYKMDVTQLIPLALAIIELIKGTIRSVTPYAKDLSISINCKLIDGEFHFTYTENMVQLPEENTYALTEMNTTLFYNFLKQIEAKVLIDKNETGQHEVLMVFSKN